MTYPFYDRGNGPEDSGNKRVSGRKLVAGAAIAGIVLSYAEKVQAGDRIVDGIINVGQTALKKVIEAF
ncbi:MAG: hypothetical protein M3Q70_03140 [bacterium]|nr:hypothetical protein [bacterium]